MLDTSSNRRKKDAIIIDDFHFEDELDVVIADYGDNTNGDN